MELPITPYGLLTDEQKKYLEDNLSYVEIYCSQGWCRKSNQHFYNVNVYRVNKPLTKPSIKSGILHPKYKWLARDSFGNIIAHDSKPKAASATWFVSGVYKAVNITSSAINPKLYDAGTCDWKDSLVYIGEE